MKIVDDEMYDNKIYVAITNNGIILQCFGNEENAYTFATRECFKYINITDEISNIDSDIDADFKTKLNLIHEKCMDLIKNCDDYYHLVRIEEHTLDTEDIYE